MKEIFVIKISRKCSCGMHIDSDYVMGDDITQSVIQADRFDSYNDAKSVAVEIILLNQEIQSRYRKELMISIEKYFI